MKLILAFVVSERDSDDQGNYVEYFKCSQCTKVFYCEKDRKKHFDIEHILKRRGRSHSVKKRVCVALKRLNFYDLEVETPRAGYRTITFTGYTNEQKSQLREYRKCTVVAIGRLLSSDTVSCSLPNKSIHLKIPELMPDVFSLFGNKNDVHSVLSVLNGEGMNVKIVDAYLSHLLQKYNEVNMLNPHLTRYKGKTSVKYNLLPVLFLPFESATDPSQSIKRNKSVYTVTENTLNKDSILICPLYCAHHFYVAILHFSTRTCYVLDSSWHFLSMEVRAMQCRKLIEELFEYQGKEEWKIYATDNCCQQLDEFSCGVYVIYYVENLLNRSEHKNKIQLNSENITRRRQDIVTVLLESTMIGKSFLEALTL